MRISDWSSDVCSSDLFPRKILEDEMLWRELKDRYGEYFEGGMGADALKSLINRLDLDIEEEKLKAAIDPEEGQRPLSAQRKQKAIKRLKIVTAFNKRNDAGKREIGRASCRERVGQYV